MVGGLIQIASYGIHDVFLIGNPQITFFKTVYRRHTNFSMEYIEEPFTGTQNFGSNLSCNISKAGDLLHRLYLKIVIPQVSLDKITYSGLNEDISKINDDYTKFKENYRAIQNFLNIIDFNLIQQFYKLLQLSSIRYNEINSKYTITYNKINYGSAYENIKSISIMFYKTFRVPLCLDLTDPSSSIINMNEHINISKYVDFANYYKLYIKTTSVDVKNDLQKLLDNYSLQIKIIKQNMNDIMILYENIYNKANRNNINFAWVDYLGHQIINRIEVMIGGKVIDFTDDVRMNINFQLTNKKFHDNTYNELIGNIPELTTYNSDTKPSYTMYIPLDFWFSKYSGISIPLIYLRFHDVKINVVLNDLIKCCYYEKLNNNVVIEDVIKLDSVTLINNYIYLDSDERRKFAQSEHEYLIDQIQSGIYTDINTIKTNIELPFFNPIKQLLWVVRDNNNIGRLKYFDYSSSYYVDIYNFMDGNNDIKTTSNLLKIVSVDNNVQNYLSEGDTIHIYNSLYYSGIYTVYKINAENIYVKFDYYINEDYSYNYDVKNNNGIITYYKSNSYSGNSQAFVYKINDYNPFRTSTLELNGIQRFYKIDGCYTNFVQAYQCNSRSPDYGVNAYSFALAPEEYQPSGFCNFNRLDLKTMTFEFDDRYINKNINKSLVLSIYGFGYNILRFAYGKAGIVLNI